MRDFQEFINEDIAVTFKDEKELLEFLKLCSKNKLRWNVGTDAYDTYHSSGSYKIVVNGTLSYKHKTHSGLYHMVIGDAKFEKMIIMSASEFLQPQTTIEISQSRKTIVCLKKQDGKVIARGVARCSKDDEFNFDYGAELAFNRMLESSKKDEFLKPLREACESISKAFSASISGISSVNSAIKSASEEKERIIKESLIKSNHIQGDAVDVVLPKIKTLKDGTKIIKQDKYEVGDKVIFKRKLKPNVFPIKVTVTSVEGVFFKCSNVSGWLHKNRIKGKVIE